ncbi:MAG: prenyltransferase/squalene oxidase repeat-containing protein [Planctomycetota bacterium]
MSLRLEMLQVARLAPRVLGDAAPRVAGFLREQITPEGGGADREGRPDLYYTAFVLDALIALSEDVPEDLVRPYLQTFGDGEDLDFVHRACLVRAWKALGGAWPSETFVPSVLDHLRECRSADGAFGKSPGRERGSLYDIFLALGIYQDVGESMPAPAVLGAAMHGLRTDDGGFANDTELRWGTGPSTAAAVAVLSQLELPVPDDVERWLVAQLHPKGGFRALPDAPMPDLLSTATTLHALSILGVDLGSAKELCLDFLDTLWNGTTFYGHWADEHVDAEYTFYALLALGHLA